MMLPLLLTSIQASTGLADAAPAKFAIKPVLIYLIGYFLFGAGYIAYMTFMIAYVRDAGGGAAAQSAFWCLIGVSAFVTPWLWRRVLAMDRGGLATAIILGVNAIGAALPLFGHLPLLLAAFQRLLSRPTYNSDVGPRRRGPIHATVRDADGVSPMRKQRAHHDHRWLWVPAFAGTTALTPAERIIALIFPVAALVVVGDFHRDHVFRILEAELGRHADLHRVAVDARQDLVGEFERHLGLRMQRARHVERRIVAVLVGALEPDILRAGIGA